jgi:ankyrin repeat protein
MVSSLHVCPEAGHIIDMLVDAGVKAETCAGGSPILEHTVAPETVDALLRHGVDPNNLCSPNGHSPLFNAAERPQILKLLLDHGAKILPDASTKLTPLHTAASLGTKDYQMQHPQRFESVELLLSHGADINAIDNEGATPLDGAYEQGDKEMADLLIKHGAKAKKHKSLEEGSEARDTENEYNELFRVAEGVRKGPACSLHIQGDSQAVMEEGPNWSIVRGTVAEVQVNCRAGGYFHYAVVGMGSPVPKALNMPLSSGTTSSAKIEFDKPWYHGVMHWYYSRERITNLVSALNRGTATHFAVRNVTVGE